MLAGCSLSDRNAGIIMTEKGILLQELNRETTDYRNRNIMITLQDYDTKTLPLQYYHITTL